MSRIGYIGRSCRILYRGEILAAVRTKAVNHVRAAIDCSDEERDGWRHLDPKYESVGVEISVEGVATAANYALLEQDWLGDTFTELAIALPDGTIEIAEDGALLSNLTYSGEHAGFVSFAATFLFSGEVHVLQELVLTSRPYALELGDAMTQAADALGEGVYPWWLEEMEQELTPLGGTLAAPLVTYGDWPPEEMEQELIPLGGTLVAPLVTYGDWPPEEME